MKSPVFSNKTLKSILITLVGVSLLFSLTGLLGARAAYNGPRFPQSVDAPHTPPVYDYYGNLIADGMGSRFNYLLVDSGFVQVQIAPDGAEIAVRPLGYNPFAQLPRAAETGIPVYQPEAIQYHPDYLQERWKAGLWGTGIGINGITLIDLDGDGQLEIVAGGGPIYDHNSYWYIASYSPADGDYRQEWLSQEYAVTINRIIVADHNNDQHYEIFVAFTNGLIEVYDAVTHQSLGSFTSVVGATDMTVADLNNDTDNEIILCSPNGIAVYDAVTFATKWQTFSYGTDHCAVGNVDGNAALEIVTSQRVIDGISHLVEWYYPDEFGSLIRLANVDADPQLEIIAAAEWSHVTAYDADLQAVKWDITTQQDIQGLYVGDIDGDGVLEIAYGDAQWGSIHVYDSLTQQEEWSIGNPDAGVTDIAFGDVDADGEVEVLWGSGWRSTAADYLYIGSIVSHTIEWQSVDATGPLSALDVGDVDNDGVNEIVVVSFESESGYNDGIIFIYDAVTYALEWRSEPLPTIAAWTGIDNLMLADVDEDGVLEIVIATADYYDGVILAYDGITHQLDWQTIEYPGASFHALEIADIDNDGHLEVIAGQDLESSGSEGIFVRIFDGRTGVEEWRTPDQTEYWFQVLDIDAADIDGDGSGEILFSVDRAAKGIRVYIYDGVSQLEEWQANYSAQMVSFLDVDQDQEKEILLGIYNTGKLYALDSQTHLEEWNFAFSSRAINSFQLADFDRDTRQELVVSDEEYLFVFDALTRDVIWSSRLGTSVGSGGHLVARDIDQDRRTEVVIGSSSRVSIFAYEDSPVDASFGVEPAISRPGGTLTYTLTLTNVAQSDVVPIITDTLPSQLTYLPGSLSGSSGSWGFSGNTVFWTLGLSPTQSASLTFATVISPTVPHESQIVNKMVLDDSLFLNYLEASTQIDALLPQTTIISPTHNQLLSGDYYTLTGTSFDQGSGVDHVEVNVNGQGWQIASGLSDWTFDLPLPISDTFLTIEARSIDRVGNIESPPVSVNVLVDNLSPSIVSTLPHHEAVDIGITTPLEIEFSEAITPESLQFTCTPDPGGWSVVESADHKKFTLLHQNFTPLQQYSCQVIQALDQAMHTLTGGPVPNPWSFTTLAPGPSLVGIDQVTIDGPSTALLNTWSTFTAQSNPITATLPVTYLWQATGQEVILQTGGLTNTITFNWTAPGTQTITLTALNVTGTASSTKTITVVENHNLYLPMMVRKNMP